MDLGPFWQQDVKIEMRTEDGKHVMRFWAILNVLDNGTHRMERTLEPRPEADVANLKGTDNPNDLVPPMFDISMRTDGQIALERIERETIG